MALLGRQFWKTPAVLGAGVSDVKCAGVPVQGGSAAIDALATEFALQERLVASRVTMVRRLLRYGMQCNALSTGT